MAVKGIFTCPVCNRPPRALEKVDGTISFFCCGGKKERSYDELIQLPVVPPDPSDPDIMIDIRD
jgi:hypothetical protein